MIQPARKEALQDRVLQRVRRTRAPTDAKGAKCGTHAAAFHLFQGTFKRRHSEGRLSQGTDEAEAGSADA